MEGVDGAVPVDREQRFDAVAGFDERFFAGGVVFGEGGEVRLIDVVAEGIGNHEVPVGQPLHQRARPEAVGPVVREIRLAETNSPGTLLCRL